MAARRTFDQRAEAAFARALAKHPRAKICDAHARTVHAAAVAAIAAEMRKHARTERILDQWREIAERLAEELNPKPRADQKGST